MVPQAALLSIDGQSKLEVLVDGQPERRVVETGARQEDRVEITKGLKAGDVVVVNPEA